MRSRLVTPAAGRIAVAGLAAVLLALAALSLWAAVGGNRWARELGRSALSTNARLQATRALARIGTLADAYDESPTTATRAQLGLAEGEMERALAELERRDSLGSRELAYDLLPKFAAYRRKRIEWLDAVRTGHPAIAERIEDAELDPLFAGMQESIDARAPDPGAGFRGELREARRFEGLIRRLTLVAVPSGLLLLLFCWSILRGYRRRSEEQARAELERSRREALTDALTGLSNRRRLAADLEEALRERDASPPRVLALFDLDGFKLYNDTFGHPAGDALLVRLSAKLADAVGERGRAYRVGGDEFCALLRPGEAGAEAFVAAAEAALGERGEGFEIGASSGSVALPYEATDPVTAMQLADRRMYAGKSSRRPSARLQARDVLLAVLRERRPELRDHLRDVAELAVAVGRRMGLDPERLDELARAAELHDIGKMAIPDAIVQKPGGLSDREWEFMRRHPVIGEGILAAAPAMAPVARLVRSSRERWDGSGYPDCLRGEAIPLGSRIVLACEAYDAMTSDRVYRRPLSHDEAMAELVGGAGGQFDPAVVDALLDVLAERGLADPQSAGAGAGGAGAGLSLPG